jgi:hypothetical protein
MGRPRGTADILIGRDDEVRRIDRLLADLPVGRPAVLVLDGPRGSGRTRLLVEVARLARRRGFTVRSAPAWTGATGARDIPPTGPLLLTADEPTGIDPRAWSVVESRAERAPVLVAITGPVRPPVGDLHRIRLTPLTPAAQAELVARTVGARPDPVLMDLCRVAAGRPGPLRELLAGCGSRPAGRRSGQLGCPGRSPPRYGPSRPAGSLSRPRPGRRSTGPFSAPASARSPSWPGRR